MRWIRCGSPKPSTGGRFGPSERPMEASRTFTCLRGLAEELRLWEQETAKTSPNGVVSRDAFIFPNSRGGFMDTGNYRNRVLNPLAERLEIPKLNFQILRRTMATQAQSMGSGKDIQAHLRHAKADTTANEYMQELPESVKRMVGEVYAMLTKEGSRKRVRSICH